MNPLRDQKIIIFNNHDTEDQNIKDEQYFDVVLKLLLSGNPL